MMSHENGTKGSNSQSESSGSSPNQPIQVLQKGDLTLYGAPAPTRISRSATVRRATTLIPNRSQDKLVTGLEDKETSPLPTKFDQTPPGTPNSERIRKSLDNSYRLSLESISEHRSKSSFSAVSLFSSRDGSSMDSSSSDCTDYAMRSTTEATKDKTFLSSSSSYLSWIESVGSEYFQTAPSATEAVDVDNKVGEWNNFWLNYNSGNIRYASSPYMSISNEDKTGEDLSDCKSTCSTQREFTDKQISMEHIFLSHEEVCETLRCSQRITEILQTAIKRNENDLEESRNDSYYSQSFPVIFPHFRKDEVVRERSRSCIEPQDLQKQRQLLKPPPQSNSSSCINVLLNSNVADILKRVINKRRDVTAPEEPSSASRASFSDWSSAK